MNNKETLDTIKRMVADGALGQETPRTCRERG